jgi:hypothetical protein
VVAVDLTISNHGIQLEGPLRMVLAVVEVAAEDILLDMVVWMLLLIAMIYELTTHWQM